MRLFHAMMGAAVAIGCVTSAQAKDAGPSLQDRQQAACFNDVQRLCGSSLPDVAKTKDCMKDKKPQVSAGCAKMWDVTQ